MNELNEWLNLIGLDRYRLEPLSGDASFRQYYRLIPPKELRGNRYIVMDSSKVLDSLMPFLEIGKKLSNAGIRTPRIIYKDILNGFLVMEDFGDTHLLDLTKKEGDMLLYQKAIDEIIKIQKTDTEGILEYDKFFLIFEMKLMQEWYVQKFLGRIQTQEDESRFDRICANICDVILEQPCNVFVHRDFHSRNIMYLSKEQTLGIIDFQDARVGPITYDLVSLLKDVYVEIDRKKMISLALRFRDRVSPQTDDATFIKWFDMTGIQRHMKILGIFSRLHLRDGKSRYLQDIPLTKKFLIRNAQRYEETRELVALFEALEKEQ